MKILLLALVAALAAPAGAAAGVTMTVRDVPLHGTRTLAAAAPSRFDMVGVHWRGSGSVLFSVRAVGGGWSAWQVADADTAPDRASAENRLRGWRLGSLDWVGAADGIRFRTDGDVTRLRAYYVESTVTRAPLRTLSLAGSPQIVPRSGWGANEAIRRAPPQYADAVHFAIVHHTAGTNDYTPAQSAAIVRGIELYHVEGNGWNDIGYNFLVDRYGRVFEGRYGGMDRPVIGAHSLGFNDGSVGIAVLGDYGSQPITDAARKALVRLLAWRLDVAHVDPLSFVPWVSGGDPRFPPGIPVILRAISGHRDTNWTDCPGDRLYAQLPEIAREVSLTGTPKLYAPKVSGKLGGLVRFTGTLTGETPWTVTIASSSGAVVAEQSGVGPTLDWTWDSSTAPSDRYTWTIAGASLRGASGSFGSAPAALAIQEAAAAPPQLSPGETTTVSYALTQPATVTATVVDANGQTVSTLFSETKPAGPQSFPFTATGLAIGDYTLELSAATASGGTATASIPLAVDDILSGFAEAPPVFSAALHQSASLTFALARAPTSIEFSVLHGSTAVDFPPVPPGVSGAQTFTWNGTLDDGNTVAPDGTYTLSLQVTDGTTTFTRTASVVLDSTPPTITTLSARGMRFRLSEPATVTLIVGNRRWTSRRRAGLLSFWLRQRPSTYSLVAVDAAGNRFTRSYRTR